MDAPIGYNRTMEKQAAISFLQANQPMPSDALMPSDLIKTYDEVRRYFIANPDTGCIDLFLRSFGEGDGFGVYQIVDEVLRQYPKSEVVPRLAMCLKSQKRSVRYWCAEMASEFPDPSLVEPLSDLLQEGDIDIHSAAVTALFTIPDAGVSSILQAAMRREADRELRERINDALEYRKEHHLDSY